MTLLPMNCIVLVDNEKFTCTAYRVSGTPFSDEGLLLSVARQYVMNESGMTRAREAIKSTEEFSAETRPGCHLVYEQGKSAIDKTIIIGMISVKLTPGIFVTGVEIERKTSVYMMIAQCIEIPAVDLEARTTVALPQVPLAPPLTPPKRVLHVHTPSHQEEFMKELTETIERRGRKDE